MRRRALLLTTGLLLVLLTLAGLFPRHAAAHAWLLRSQPANGTVVQPTIGEIRLTFTERVDVRPDSITVQESAGRRIDLRNARSDPRDPATVIVGVPQLGNGVYTVRYALVSGDTHTTTGAFRFGVGVTPADVLTGATAQQDSTITAATWVEGAARWLTLLGLVLLIGPIVFRLFILVPFRASERTITALRDAVRLYDARTVRFAWIAVVLLIIGQVATLIAASLASSFDDVSAALQPGALAGTLVGRFGTLWLLRLALLLVPAIAIPLVAAEQELRAATEEAAPAADRGAGAWWAILISGAALSLTTSLGGHAATTAPILLSLAVDWAHLMGTVCWIGGLLALALILPGIVRSLGAGAGAPILAGALPRFSILALGAIQVIVVTGFYQTWAHVAGPEQLTSTAYGQTLLVKLLLILPLIGLAAYNRFVVLPRLRHLTGPATGEAVAKTPATGRLWRTVWGETLLSVVVLAVVGLLTSLPPARTAAANRPDTPVASAGDSGVSSGITLASNAGALLVTLTIGPTSAGPAVLSATLRDGVGQALEDATVEVQLTSPDGKAPQTVALTARGGRYLGLGDLGARGRWQIAVNVAAKDGSGGRATFALNLPASGAQALLVQADAAMNRLTSLRERQTLAGAGATLTTTYEFVAPDRLHLTASSGSETIIAGKKRFDRQGTRPWITSDWPEQDGYRWPKFDYASTASEVTILGQEEIDGVRCWVVAFLDSGAEARLTLWIGADDGLIRQQQMFTVGHYMESHFSDFNAPITIMVPQQ